MKQWKNITSFVEFSKRQGKGANHFVIFQFASLSHITVVTILQIGTMLKRTVSYIFNKPIGQVQIQLRHAKLKVRSIRLDHVMEILVMGMGVRESLWG